MHSVFTFTQITDMQIAFNAGESFLTCSEVFLHIYIYHCLHAKYFYIFLLHVKILYNQIINSTCKVFLHADE